MNKKRNFSPTLWGSLLCMLLSLANATPLHSQTNVPGKQLAGSKTFAQPEQLRYSVYFTWGFIKGKAGEAVILTREMKQRDQWFQQLKFRTTGIFESVFPMRDTLETLYGASQQPMRWEKRVSEGGDYLVDEITYTPLPNKWAIHSRRYNSTSTSIDTTFMVNNNKPVVDLLSTITLVRNLNLSLLKPGYQLPFTVVLGKSQVPCILVYSGIDILTLPNKSDVECIRMDLNIHDEAFHNHSKSAQVWISNNEQALPVRIRAKLKIGYAECNLVEHLPLR